MENIAMTAKTVGDKVLITVEANDLWVLLLSSVRYSLGRRSYVVGLTQDLIKKYWTALEPDQLDKIANEVEDWIAQDCREKGYAWEDRDWNWRDFPRWCRQTAVREKTSK